MAKKEKKKVKDESVKDIEVSEMEAVGDKMPMELPQSSNNQSDYQSHPKFAKFNKKGDQN